MEKRRERSWEGEREDRERWKRRVEEGGAEWVGGRERGREKERKGEREGGR